MKDDAFKGRGKYHSQVGGVQGAPGPSSPTSTTSTTSTGDSFRKDLEVPLMDSDFSFIAERKKQAP